MWYVYILNCEDHSPYTGCTIDLKNRLLRHNKGHIPATKNRKSVNLHCYFAFTDKYTTYNFEKYLKSGSGRAFMQRHFYQKPPVAK